jgi:hypothetical protein
MDARQHHIRFARLAAFILGGLLAWGLWQCYGDWLFAMGMAHVA